MSEVICDYFWKRRGRQDDYFCQCGTGLAILGKRVR